MYKYKKLNKVESYKSTGGQTVLYTNTNRDVILDHNDFICIIIPNWIEDPEKFANDLTVLLNKNNGRK